jgi:peptidyl-prolyl cis-trans isomerase A (cyclophilin A)
MKQFALILIAAAAALAQTPAPKPPVKTAPKTAAAPNLLNPSTLKARAPEMFRVRFNTTKGDVIVEITRSWAPNGADRFYNLVRGGFFNGCAIFRVIRSPQPFMAQFGISPRPEVNRAWANQTLLDDPVKESNKRGRITYGNTGAPNSRGTQLFINYADNTFLDSQRAPFAPIGEVVEGMDNADKFYAGYGENPPDFQDKLTNEGKAYTDKAFPMLDRIITATIVPAAPAATPPDAKK